jgi:tubulin--tyrosine ligase
LYRYNKVTAAGLSLGIKALLLKLFHFFSYRPAIRYHIERRLLERGWQKTANAKDALFADRHLTLPEESSNHLEYKHLLAQLVGKYCKDVMLPTYCINDKNYPQVFAKIIYDHYLVNGQYQADQPHLKWILKPSMLNNGDGIKLFNNIEELKRYYGNPKRLGGEHVVQQYLADPALIDGKKYTFRVAAVLTNYTGVYLCQHGYINISGYPFSMEDSFINRKAHITNYVLDGEFANIEQRSTQLIKEFEPIYQQIANIIRAVIKGLLKTDPHYLAPQKTKIMEIFGCDFILDQKGKVWLLEINQGPDAPTFEENPLNEILWEPFWEDIIEDFVLPIALDVPPKSHYARFTQLLTAKQCYHPIQAGWYYMRKMLPL